MSRRGGVAGGGPVLELRGVVKHFPVRRGLLRRQVGVVRAVDGVTLDVLAGETVGLVGESGSGKTTLARAALHLDPPTGGTVRFAGADPSTLPPEALRRMRREAQMIFQDPFASLDPRMRVGRTVEEPLAVHGLGGRAERGQAVRELLERVGLDPRLAQRYPHELSGGQRQRVGIARALATRPRLVVADEPISALDVSIQAQIVNLMEDLKDELGLTYLFIAHDLSMVRHVSRRVAVMYLGKLAEAGPADDVLLRPLHPYTRTLAASMPRLGARRGAAPGPDPDEAAPPDPAHPPPGCRYHARCPFATERCRLEEPAWRAVDEKRHVACHHAETLP